MKNQDVHCFLIDNIKDHHRDITGDGFVHAAKIIKQFSLLKQSGFVCSTNVFDTILQTNFKKIKPLINIINSTNLDDIDSINNTSQKIKKLIATKLVLPDQITSLIKQIKPNASGVLIKRTIIDNNNPSRAIHLSYNNTEVILASKKPQDIITQISDLYISLYNQQEIVEREQHGLDHVHISVVISVHALQAPEEDTTLVTISNRDINLGLGVMNAFSSQGYSINIKNNNQFIFANNQHVPVIKQVITQKNNLSQTNIKTIGKVGYFALENFGVYKINLLITENSTTLISLDQISQPNISQYTNAKKLWIGETPEPIAHVKAQSYGVCISQKPHNNILFVESLDFDNINLSQDLNNIDAILVSSSHVNKKIVSFLRERGIACLININNSEIKKHKKITIVADKENQNHDGFIYSGYVNFEYRSSLLSKEKLETPIYSLVRDIHQIKHIAQLPVSGVYFDIQNLLDFYNIEIGDFFEKNIDSNNKKYLLNLVSGAKNRSQVLQILLTQSISMLAAQMQDRKVIIKIPWFNDYDKYIHIVYSVISNIINNYKFTNIAIISDYQKTPEHLDMFVKQFGVEDLEVGLEVDVFKNEMLSDEFASSSDIALFNQVDVLNNTISAKKIIKNFNNKKTETLVFTDSNIFNNQDFDTLIQLNIRGMVVEPDQVLKYHETMTFLEKTIGRKGKKTHVPITVMIAVIGAFFALLILLVSGFNAVRNPVTVLNRSNTEISPADLRMKLLEHADRVKEEEFDAQRSTLQVSDFAQFTMQYPSWWRVSYWNGGVTVTDPNSGEFISIFRQLVGHPISDNIREKITIDGYNAEKFTDQLPKDGSSVDIVEINVDGDIIEINATSERFTELLTTFKFIDTTGLNGKTPTHWDVRDGNFCVQMITYARKNKDDRCEVFSTPCDVPKYWEVCDSNDQ